MLYGQHNIGKSTWAAKAKGAVFIDIEGGLDDLECMRSPKCESLRDVRHAVDGAAALPDTRWIVFDTLDWLETLVWQQVCDVHKVDSIEKVGGGYGKGYTAALQLWDRILAELDRCRDNGIGVILIAHAKIARFENPEGASFDRYQPALHDKAAAAVMEWCDEVLFASTRTVVVKEDAGFNKERGIAMGGKERYIRTNESAAAIAKNRLGLPEELPLDWSAYASFLPPPSAMNLTKERVSSPLEDELAAAFDGSSGDINGIVVDGSSKVAAGV